MGTTATTDGEEAVRLATEWAGLRHEGLEAAEWAGRERHASRAIVDDARRPLRDPLPASDHGDLHGGRDGVPR